MATTPITQGEGWGLLIGFSVLFIVIIFIVSFFMQRYAREADTAEHFNTASRSVKSGLIACAVTSSWTWAATLLQSTTLTYTFGVSGALHYATGATVQILLFAILAIDLKRRAPSCHTFVEIVKARYGKAAHIIYLIFGLMTNCLVSNMLIVGGGATFNALTNIHPVACMFILPLSVLGFTGLSGQGLRATFIVDYVHTACVLIIALYFCFKAYATGDVLGSISKLYDGVVEAGKLNPVAGNQDGSYLTIRSHSGALFLGVQIISAFATVFIDQGYWCKAISSSSTAALKGYMLGGIAWCGIPWAVGSVFGLSALALERSPQWPTYPRLMTSAEVTAGLTLPYAASALLGKGGAVAAFILLFGAVTSAFSAQLISVSSLATYDIYATYINRKANDKQLHHVSQFSTMFWTLLTAGLSCCFYYVGATVGFLYYLMGIVSGSCVLGVTLICCWRGFNKQAAIYSPVIGLVFGVIVWLVETHFRYHELNQGTLDQLWPALAGCITTLLTPVPVLVICALIWGRDKMQWPELNQKIESDQEFRKYNADIEKEFHEVEISDADKVKLAKASMNAKILAFVFAFFLLVVWTVPLYASRYVFTRPFLSSWLAFSVIWLFVSIGCVTVYPIYDGRDSIMAIWRGLMSELSGKGRPPVEIEGQQPRPSSQSAIESQPLEKS